MVIKTLKGTKTKEILKVFNLAFSDYFIPLNLTEEQLLSKMKADKTDLNLSVGVFVDGELIAFILHGFDTVNGQKLIYNGGTGVIPNKRGAGLTKQMYSYILPILEEKGINQIILEVINENVQAIKSYKYSGFKTQRDLLCYKGEATIPNIERTNLEIKELNNYEWEKMEGFWDTCPTWQNSKSVVNELKSKNISLGAYFHNELVGYVIYSPPNSRIQHIAVSKEYRQNGVASCLMSELINKFGSKLSIINVDKSSKPINEFLTAIGLTVNITQLEMVLQLDK